MDCSSNYSQYKLSLSLKNVIGIIRGTMYTKCVSTAPRYTVLSVFLLNLKDVIGINRGTMYTKCEWTVPLVIVSADDP